jgi:mRNA-degrading endonuclease toxin of MazEF toxin-antitoxin module
VPVGPDDGLSTESVINLDDILTIPMAALDRRITLLNAEKMREVGAAIKYALDSP